jgi:hypothetical protein
MNRLYPEPLPRIHPLPEYLATGKRKQWYEEMKEAMQVPWMGVVTMAYAHYPDFFETFWEGTQPLVRSRPFVEECESLRKFTESEAAKLRPPPIGMRLEHLGYAGREIAQIRGMLEIFSHGNFPYLLLATIVRMLLEGGELGDGSMRCHSKDATHRHAGRWSDEIHRRRADASGIRGCETHLGPPFVNTDYRALARRPTTSPGGSI